MGGFILIDRAEQRHSRRRPAAAIALRRSHNIHWQAVWTSRARRIALGDEGAEAAPCLWFTGLSGSPASRPSPTWSSRSACTREGRHTYLLDGDNIRHGLTRDLGFTDADRVENIRRVG